MTFETQAWICPACHDDHKQGGECTSPARFALDVALYYLERIERGGMCDEHKNCKGCISELLAKEGFEQITKALLDRA